MGLAENVSALLETYDNCVSLLKAFKKQKKQDPLYRPSKADERQALLRRSLRSDRKKVDRAYASRVSEAGSLFEKGDTKARSALTRVLKRLNAMIAGLIRVASKGAPAIDYQSLLSLSNSSRLQAIKAFDQLSHRIQSKSSQSAVVCATVATSSSSSSSSTVVASSRSSHSTKGSSKISKSKSSSSKASTASSWHNGTTSQKHTAKVSKQPPHSRSHSHFHSQPPPPRYDIRRKPLPPNTSRSPPPRYSSSSSDNTHHHHKALPPLPGLPSLPEITIHTPLLDSMAHRDRQRMEADDGDLGLGLLLRRRPSMMVDRYSLMTVESGSTRLGEIPERKWRRGLGGFDEWGAGGCREDEYSAPVVYPLRPYAPVVKERRFLGLFRRGAS